MEGLNPFIMPKRNPQTGKPDRDIYFNETEFREKLRTSPMKRTKPFVGWRCWGVRLFREQANQHQHTFLTSTSIRDEPWSGPVRRTKNNFKVNSIIPQSNNKPIDYNKDWGVFSYKTPSLLLNYFLPDISNGGLPVVGRIDLTGHVVEHQLGFRAQIATVRELWVMPPFDGRSIMRELSLTYECEVHKLKSPNDLIPWASYMTQEYEKENL